MSTLRDLLACRLHDQIVALPLERVIGVVEGGSLTPLPYSAAAFEGLVEAFGQIVPQVGLATLLGAPPAPGTILVVVSDRGGSLALRVSHVIGMVQVDDDAVAAGASRARARNPLFAGEIEANGQTLSLLDLDLLATSEGLELSGSPGAVILPESIASEPSREVEDEWLPHLLLDIHGDRYAIPNTALVELAVPGAIRPMPGAPPWILGLIDVRGTPVAAISTAALLGRDVGHPEVCLLAELDDHHRVALFVDRAVGLERVAPNAIHPMTQPMAGISGYFVLGDAIVGVIDLAQLLEQVEGFLRTSLPAPPAQPIAIDAGKHASKQQLLTMRVGRELYAMTLDRIERIQASVTLTPLPDTLAYFDGMADVGDAIVPVIDLRRQQGAPLTAFEVGEKPPCILTTLEGALTGILVDQVLSILDVANDRFEPVKDASRLPISHVVAVDDRLVSVLTLDRLLPQTVS